MYCYVLLNGFIILWIICSFWWCYLLDCLVTDNYFQGFDNSFHDLSYCFLSTSFGHWAYLYIPWIFVSTSFYTNVNSNIIIFICFVDLKLMTAGGTKIPQQFFCCCCCCCYYHYYRRTINYYCYYCYYYQKNLMKLSLMR